MTSSVLTHNHGFLGTALGCHGGKQKNPTLKHGFRGENKRKKETKSVVNFSSDTVFQDKWQLLTSQDSLLIIKDFFKITLLKICIYSFTSSISQSLFQVNCEVPEYQWPWRHTPASFSSTHCCLPLTKVLAGSEARPAPPRVISKGPSFRLSLSSIPCKWGQL